MHTEPLSTFRIARQENFTQEMVKGKYVSTDPNSFDYCRHRIPTRSVRCHLCNALMWIDKKLSASSNKNSKFGIFCLNGTVSITLLNPLPLELFDLITQISVESKKFRTHIRLYNSILAFTTSSAKVDESLLKATSGVYTFRINGSVHHKLSSYLPSSTNSPKFSQIYIYDSEMKSSIRSGLFPKVINS